MGGRKSNISKFPFMKGSPPTKSHKLGDLEIPEARMNVGCTVAEAVQISLAAAQDIVQAYTGEVNKLVIQQTVYLEGLKQSLISKGVVTEEEFSEILKKVTDDFNNKRSEYLDTVLNKETKEEELTDEANDPGSN